MYYTGLYYTIVCYTIQHIISYPIMMYGTIICHNVQCLFVKRDGHVLHLLPMFKVERVAIPIYFYSLREDDHLLHLTPILK